MDLESIPGVGRKTAEALRTLDDPEAAIEREDVAALTRAAGVSEGRAARIVRSAIRERHDDPGEFLATDRAREIYDAALSLLQERAVTTYAEKRLETLYPSAVSSRVDESRAFTERALHRSIESDALDALERVSPLSPPRTVTVRDRCLATTDGETYATATDRFPELSVEVVDDARDLADLARGYSTVIALDEAFAGVDVAGDVRVEPDALERPAEIVPERSLAFFASNRTAIRAAIEVHRAADLETETDLESMESAVSRLNDDGSVAGDDELERLETAIDDLDAAASTAESIANDHLKEAIAERDVTIEGADLLSLVERGAGVDSLLSQELAAEFDDAIQAARDHLVDALDLADDEAEIARRAFPEDPTYPVDRDDETISRLRESLVADRDRRAASRKRAVAGELADRKAAARTLVRTALELDVEYAIARFARDFSCAMPTLAGRGFDIEGGRSPLLPEPFEEVEPVDYAVDGVAVLSGVNSGGKTSTLDLVALVTILAHMGLPVPAERARVPDIDEFAYYGKTQGTLDAGAFESTLRDFADIADGAAAKLVLVDELESITEPGASARIIAGILEELHADGSSAVFVSHLAGEVRDACEFDVTVDGIRALGLEDGELIVDRTPRKDHLARSTPELIVEKLAGEDDRDFYERLLEKF